MKQRITVAFLAAVLATTLACGGGGNVTFAGGSGKATGSNGLTTGNWLLVATSQVASQSGNVTYTYLRGALAKSGSAVTGTLRPSSGCLLNFQTSALGDPVAFSGSLTGSNLTLASANVNGSVASITGAVSNGTNLNGTYIAAGGASTHFSSNGLCDGNYGTVYGTLVPSVTGPWNGMLLNTSQGDPTCARGNYCSGANLSSGKIYTNYLPTADTVFGDGSFVLQVGTGQPVTIIVDSSNDTLNLVAPYINSLKMGVKATAATDATGSRLSLSDSSGNQGMITLTGNTTGLVFPDMITISASLQQGTTPNQDGSFPLSGTMAVQGLSCYGAGGNIDSTQSFIQGDNVRVVVENADGTTISISPGSILNPNSALQVSVQSATNAACSGSYATGTICAVDANGICRQY